MIIMDADDGFSGRNTFKVLNAIYQKDDVWASSGSHITVSDAFPQSDWIRHPRLFYAKLAHEMDLRKMID